jgi:hypothetical protein
MTQRTRFWPGVFVAATLLLAAGCSGNSDGRDASPHTDPGTAKPQKVTIDWQPDPAAPQAGQAVALTAHVTLDNQPVNDAEVDLEVWKEGSDAHETLKPTVDAQGHYTARKTFDQGGLYHVTIHTTARGLHQMPTRDLKVN